MRVFWAGSQNRSRLFVVELLKRISTKPIQMISLSGAEGLQQAMESRLIETDLDVIMFGT